MKFPIEVSAVKPTKRTSRITGLSSVADILAAKAKGTLFADAKGATLDALLEDVYNGKLKASHKQVLAQMTEEEKRDHAISILTFQAELTQEAPRKVSDKDPERVNVVGFFMSARLNVSNQTAVKKLWLTLTTESLEEYDLKKGVNYSQVMLDRGYFTHILRMTSFEPELNDAGLIVSAPKRAGQNGDILTRDGKLLFQHVEAVQQKVTSEEQFNELEAQFIEGETLNAEEYKHDGTIDVVANNVPLEKRSEDPKADGAFTPDFQEWLHDQVGVSLGLQVTV